MSESAEKLDPDEFFETFTGFEEIAVKRVFGVSPTSLAYGASERGGMDVPSFLRSLWFVKLKRDGMADPDAYTATMNATAAFIMGRFKNDEEAAGEGKAPAPETSTNGPTS